MVLGPSPTLKTNLTHDAPQTPLVNPPCAASVPCTTGACAKRGGRWALDGYPRQVGAAEHLLRPLDSLDFPVLKVVHLQLIDNEVMRRLLHRGREDDTPESVEKRLAVYREEVLSAVTYLRGPSPKARSWRWTH
ncbi:nucleoside monophosphate kinase [Deinococcus malanensis]|uniref:nucleoside monophosphate kinase n=1 Tax=Deinococcus malanensis TaxID=1706855 RepID=UPI00362D174B